MTDIIYKAEDITSYTTTSFAGAYNNGQKVNQTLDAAILFVILALSALQFDGVIDVADKYTPGVYGALAAFPAVFKIWGRALRRIAARR
jgi:hypothetical protein